MTQPGAELARLTEARNALALARTLDEVKAIRDVAVAAKRYAEAKKLGAEAERYAAEVVLRADRRLGEMLRDDPTIGPGKGSTLEPLGLKKGQSHRAQQIAKIPEPVFEQHVANGRDLSQNRLLRVAREAEAEARRAQPTQARTVVSDVDIRHGDFREALADIQSGTVDAVITDPPYPGEFVCLFVDLSQLAARILKPGGVLAVMCGQYYLPEYIASLADSMRYRWCGAYIAQGPRTRVHAAKVGTGWKPILLFQQHSTTNDDRTFILDDLFDSAGDDKAHHHWGQSESGIAALVERLTQQGALIVDPFLGGGTTALVCRDLGRRFIGCDIDAAAVATSRERVA